MFNLIDTIIILTFLINAIFIVYPPATALNAKLFRRLVEQERHHNKIMIGGLALMVLMIVFFILSFKLTLTLYVLSFGLLWLCRKRSMRVFQEHALFGSNDD